MKQISFGNSRVGCQALFYFEDSKEAYEFGEDEKRYLRLHRRNKKRPRERNNLEIEYILNKWSKDRMLINFLKRIAQLVDEEDVNEHCWIENGKFY